MSGMERLSQAATATRGNAGETTTRVMGGEQHGP
jgi:hypothetical protein